MTEKPASSAANILLPFSSEGVSPARVNELPEATPGAAADRRGWRASAGSTLERSATEGASADDSSGPASRSLRALSTPESMQRSVLVVGDIVADRYRVESVIGAGGMGIVYKAKHLELDTWVAIKVIRPDIAQNSSLWRRFAREARALAALHNQNVVRVHDAGTLPSGLRYLVMELLHGTDLRRLLSERGSLPVPEAVDYALQVCSALGDAHRLNIVHRDIKPENIFLAQFRACEPTIKLLDFGVARFLDDKGQLTVPGRGVGSPRYLSPEQIISAGTSDQRSDIWGVGLLLYELISGRSPFEGMNTAEACLSICQGSFQSIVSLRPDLAPALCGAIMHCLEPDPNGRFQNADDLSAALEPFSSRHPRTQQAPAEAEAESPTPPLPRARKRGRGLTAATTETPSDEASSAPAEVTQTVAKKSKRSGWYGLVPRWARGAHPS
jgi:serine/threonine protein kinase